MTWTPNPVKKIRRGFALLSPEQRREVASKGGKAVHAKGNGHKWTKEEAKIAGRRGGIAIAQRKREALPETKDATTEGEN
jgi:general stress protein YciG